MARWVALSFAVLSSLIGLENSLESAVAIVVLNLVGLSMIFRPGWWTFWMPLGFWEQRASDSRQADQQGTVIAFLGWIVILLALILSTQL